MRAARTALSLALAALLLAALGLTALCVRPAGRTAGGESSLSLAARLEDRLSRAQGAALEGLTYVRKIYRLGENVTTAPAPDADAGGVTADPGVIDALFADSAELMEGQTSVWNSGRAFAEGSAFRYYADETILAVVWQERRVPATITFCEVKIADGSQLRRKLAEDTYGSGVLKAPTELAAECNAVVAMDADFYRYRNYGVNVYQGALYRWNGGAVDSCFFDRAGNMLFAYAGQLTTQTAAQAFVDANDVVTGISFGPAMVDGGVNVTPASYPVGEYADDLARCCIGQVGERHYLLCAADYWFTVSEMAELMVSRGTQRAYNVDGGQSSAIILLGKMCNPTFFGCERAQSDILYFATAVPNG